MISRVIIVDVGTHRAQEIRIIADRGARFRASVFVRVLRHHRNLRRTWQDFSSICKAQDRLADLQFALLLVEPMFHDELVAALRLPATVSYIKGVVSSSASGAARLLLARSGDLGHSVIASKPNLSGRSVDTYNFDFRDLLPWYLNCMGRGSSDAVVLRMNAEGVERGIIEWLCSAEGRSVRIDALMGSTGDIRKCFGSNAEQDARLQLCSAGIPFTYFTASPGSWACAMEALVALVSAR